MITQELNAYIRQQLEAGIAKDAIKQTLSVSGWGEQDLNDAFFAIESSQSLQSVTPSPDVQMSIQSLIQPTSSRGYKEMWTIVIGLLLIIGTGSAFAAYHYNLFTLPVATTTASSSPLTNTNNNNVSTTSTPANNALSTNQESSNTGSSTTTSSSTNVASSIPSAKLTINNATSVVASESNFTLKWSSTNADKFSTTQSLSSCFIPAMNKTDTVTNNISSAYGTDSSLAFTNDELAILAGCDMNITYIAENTKMGKKAHAVVNILFPSDDGTTKQLTNMTSPQTQPTNGN